jgi:hypothetical protein
MPEALLTSHEPCDHSVEVTADRSLSQVPPLGEVMILVPWVWSHYWARALVPRRTLVAGLLQEA